MADNFMYICEFLLLLCNKKASALKGARTLACGCFYFG